MTPISAHRFVLRGEILNLQTSFDATEYLLGIKMQGWQIAEKVWKLKTCSKGQACAAAMRVPSELQATTTNK